MLEGWIPLPEAEVRRYRETGVLRDQTLGEVLDEAASRYRERTALVAGSTRMTYLQLHAAVECMADHLYALGLRPTERVVVHMPNLPEFVILYFALVKIGALPITAISAHRAAEINHFIKHSGAVAYAIPSRYRNFDYLALAREQKQLHPHLRLVLVADREFAGEPGFVSLPRLLDRDAPKRPAFRPDPFDVGLFQLSGGTTGLPKLIPRTHADYAYNSRIVTRASDLRPESVTLLGIPASHNFPLLWAVQGTLMTGGTLVLVYEPDPTEMLKLIERERATVVPGVPALQISLMDRQRKENRDISSLELIVTGGSKFIPSAVDRALNELGCQVQQCFGMAEGFCTGTLLDAPLETIRQTVGSPLSEFDEYRLVDPQDRPVPRGEIGELLVRGPYTIRGFYRVPEINARSFTSDGFYRTGDLMRLEESGCLVVEGRSKDTINRAGEKFSAEEVEDLVADHPKVRSSTLVAMPDPVTGEKGCLFVIPHENQSLTLAEIVAHMEKKRVARFKFPERLEVVHSFPMTAVGKVSRRDLRDMIAQKIKQEAAAK